MGDVDRRRFLTTAAAMTFGALAMPGTGLPAIARPRASRRDAVGGLVRPDGVSFGISAQRRGTETQIDAVLRMEQTADRPFDTVMQRMPWSRTPANAFSRWIGNSGRIPLLAWFSRKPDVPWNQIASGAHDDRIRTEARKIRDAGWPCYFSFHKEPEDEPQLGDALAFRSAHDRVWQLFHDEEVSNAVFVPVLMASTFAGGHGGADRWLPKRYDLLGVDGYNRNISGNWRSAEGIFGPARDHAVRSSRPLMIVESGCVEGALGQKGQWFIDAAAVLTSWPEVVYFSYNDEMGDRNYRVDTSSSSVDGYRRMGADPSFNPAETWVERAVA